jgi:hypothetical protein
MVALPPLPTALPTVPVMTPNDERVLVDEALAIARNYGVLVLERALQLSPRWKPSDEAMKWGYFGHCFAQLVVPLLAEGNVDVRPLLSDLVDVCLRQPAEFGGPLVVTLLDQIVNHERVDELMRQDQRLRAQFRPGPFIAPPLPKFRLCEVIPVSARPMMRIIDIRAEQEAQLAAYSY